jgi:hypothetical protein
MVLSFRNCVVFTRSSGAEEETNFSHNEVTSIAASWSDSLEPKDLAAVLEVDVTPEEEDPAIDQCSFIIHQWLNQSCGDSR